MPLTKKLSPMNENILKAVQVAANLAIIFLAVTLGAVLIKTYVAAPKPALTNSQPYQVTNQPTSAFPRPALPPDTQIQPGAKLEVPGIDWTKNGRTLVMAVSDKCHYCTESAPFYQQLAKSHQNVRLIALLPQPPDQGRQYMDHLQVSVDEVRQAPLTTLGIRGTPTLILLDSGGAIVKAWRGKLTADKESEVLASLKG